MGRFCQRLLDFKHGPTAFFFACTCCFACRRFAFYFVPPWWRTRLRFVGHSREKRRGKGIHDDDDDEKKERRGAVARANDQRDLLPSDRERLSVPRSLPCRVRNPFESNEKNLSILIIHCPRLIVILSRSNNSWWCARLSWSGMAFLMEITLTITVD